MDIPVVLLLSFERNFQHIHLLAQHLFLHRTTTWWLRSACCQCCILLRLAPTCQTYLLDFIKHRIIWPIMQCFCAVHDALPRSHCKKNTTVDRCGPFRIRRSPAIGGTGRDAAPLNLKVSVPGLTRITNFHTVLNGLFQPTGGSYLFHIWSFYGTIHRPESCEIWWALVKPFSSNSTQIRCMRDCRRLFAITADWKKRVR